MTTSGSDTVDERIAWGLTRPVRKNSGEANTESSSTISDDDTWYTQLSNLDGYIDDDEANQKLIAFGSGVHRKCTFYGSVSIPSSGGGVDCETTDDDDGDAKYYFYYYWDYDDDQESGKGDDDDDYNYYSTKRRLGGKQDDDGGYADDGAYAYAYVYADDNSNSTNEDGVGGDDDGKGGGDDDDNGEDDKDDDSCPGTCYGENCEYWYFANTDWTCENLETEFGCDCAGCYCNHTFTPTITPTYSPTMVPSKDDVIFVSASFTFNDLNATRVENNGGESTIKSGIASAVSGLKSSMIDNLVITDATSTSRRGRRRRLPSLGGSTTTATVAAADVTFDIQTSASEANFTSVADAISQLTAALNHSSAIISAIQSEAGTSDTIFASMTITSSSTEIEGKFNPTGMPTPMPTSLPTITLAPTKMSVREETVFRNEDGVKLSMQRLNTVAELPFTSGVTDCTLSALGDGTCDSSRETNNNDMNCGFDDGDCCVETCVSDDDGASDCTTSNSECKSPVTVTKWVEESPAKQTWPFYTCNGDLTYPYSTQSVFMKVLEAQYNSGSSYTKSTPFVPDYLDLPSLTCPDCPAYFMGNLTNNRTLNHVDHGQDRYGQPLGARLGGTNVIVSDLMFLSVDV